VKGSVSTDSIPPISRPGGKLPTEDSSVLTIRQILKYALSVVIIITATTGEQLSDCLSDECFVSTYSCHLVVMLISLPHYVEMAGEIFVFSDVFIC